MFLFIFFPERKKVLTETFNAVSLHAAHLVATWREDCGLEDELKAKAQRMETVVVNQL